jgi:hypothetical protein
MVQIERSTAGVQLVIPGCERRTLPKSSSSANWFGQGLLGFYAEPTHQETLAVRINAPMSAKKSQKALANQFCPLPNQLSLLRSEL